MNHDTSYRPDWAVKLGGTEVAKKKPAKKKKMDMSVMKMKGGKVSKASGMGRA